MKRWLYVLFTIACIVFVSYLVFKEAVFDRLGSEEFQNSFLERKIDNYIEDLFVKSSAKDEMGNMLSLFMKCKKDPNVIFLKEDIYIGFSDCIVKVYNSDFQLDNKAWKNYVVKLCNPRKLKDGRWKKLYPELKTDTIIFALQHENNGQSLLKASRIYPWSPVSKYAALLDNIHPLVHFIPKDYRVVKPDREISREIRQKIKK